MTRRILRSAGLSGLLALGVAASGSLAVPGMALAARSARAAVTLYVAPAKVTAGESTACKTAKHHTIPSALKVAKSGDTVEVCAGTYTAFTTISTGAAVQPKITTNAEVPSGVHLVGQKGATIDATGHDNGVTFFASTGASVSGFTVEHALGEGILAVLASKITIKSNVVEHNDNGGATSGWSECQPSGQIPGDCGEGIHLMSTSASFVSHNTSAYNSGGILLTDEFGPNHGNTVNKNLVFDNLSDCGVTVVSHNSSAVNSSGVPQPAKGGTYKNVISGNQIISNGTMGEGAGIVFASAVSGGGSYDNTVKGNEIVGNGISGVTIHQHAPVTDVSGNVIENNWIGTNNLNGDPGTGDSRTTGVLVDNGGTHKLIKLTVTGNTIAYDTYGIYDDTGLSGLTRSGNTFIHVTVHVKS
jgi:hypothetical protein